MADNLITPEELQYYTEYAKELRGGLPYEAFRGTGVHPLISLSHGLIRPMVGRDVIDFVAQQRQRNAAQAYPVTPSFDDMSRAVSGRNSNITTGSLPDQTERPNNIVSDYRNRIGSVESSNNYGALGPRTRSGDRAYGRYQVMGANIPTWTREALGRELTPQQFLADRQAQDAVFNHRFGTYLQRYGSPERASAAWFAGERGMNNPNASDQLGTTVSSYVDRVRNASGSPGRMNLGAGDLATENAPEGATAPATSGRTRLAQAGERQPGDEFGAGNSDQLPVGVPPRIAPNPSLNLLEQQVRNIAAVPPDQREKVYQQYQAALQPIMRETAAGTSYYHPRTGAHLYTVPKLQDLPLSVGGASIPQRGIMGPTGLDILPTGPLGNNQNQTQNQNQNGNSGDSFGVPGGSTATGERTPYGIQRDLPQSGRVGDIIQFGQEADAARRLTDAAANDVIAARQRVPIAQRQITLLDTMLAASRRGGFVRGQPTADVVQQARTLISNLNPVLPEYLRVNTEGLSNADTLNKLHGQLSALASQAMSGRGTNLDLNTASSTIPGLQVSQQSLEMLISILKQENRAQIRIGQAAQRLGVNNINDLYRLQQEEYERHPIEMQLPDGRTVTTKAINSRADVEALPSGTWFISPNGQLQQRR